jgi:hypothetical protein
MSHSPRYLPILGIGAIVGDRGLSVLHYVEFDSIAVNLLRIVFTPRPWSITWGTHGFVALGAALHWLFLLPTCIGAVRLVVDSSAARLIAIYCLGVLVFYAAVPELLGPRQRYQSTFGWAWFQFHFLWTYRNVVAIRLPSSSEIAAEPTGVDAG